MRKIDLTGKVINGITVVSKIGPNNYRSTLWLCTCHCGKQFTPTASNLKSGKSLSCGCLRLKIITKHGDSKTAFYQCWVDLRDRCTNPIAQEYKNYGARGITYCDRWNDYLLFKQDMHPTYKIGLSIDRINVNGNYEPDNCKWSTQKQQLRNTRRNRYIETPFGKITLVEVSEKSKIHYSTLSFRLRSNPQISYQELTAPLHHGHRYK